MRYFINPMSDTLSGIGTEYALDVAQPILGRTFSAASPSLSFDHLVGGGDQVFGTVKGAVYHSAFMCLPPE
jgi:hypothetical protein